MEKYLKSICVSKRVMVGTKRIKIFVLQPQGYVFKGDVIEETDQYIEIIDSKDGRRLRFYNTNIANVEVLE